MVDDVEVQDGRSWHFFIVENAIEDDFRLDKPYHISTYNALCRFADKEGECFPSLPTLAKYARCSEPTVIKALDKLRECGHILKTARTHKNLHQSNIYRLVTVVNEVNHSEQQEYNNTSSGVVNEVNQGGKRGLPGVVNGVKGNYIHLNKNHLTKEYIPAFESFWNEYPRHREKAKAFKKWNARIREGVSEDVLILTAKHYKLECDAEGREARFIKHGATFLGPDRPYEEYIEPPKLLSKKPAVQNQEVLSKAYEEALREEVGSS